MKSKGTSMEFFFFYFCLSVLCAALASSRGRSGFGYFILALLVSPLLCGLLLLIIGKNASSEDSDGPSPDTHVKCPDCRELILKDARVCKHCGCKLLPQQ